MNDLISKQTFKEECLKAGFFPAQIAAVLKRTPAVDAVEVVRCYKCKYGEIDDPGFPRQHYCHSGGGWHDANFYCADGERKENG